MEYNIDSVKKINDIVDSDPNNQNEKIITFSDKNTFRPKKRIDINRVFRITDTETIKKIKINAESLMYVSRFIDAESITDIICHHLRILNKKPHLSTIVDATGGIGGDTSALSKKFMKVISIEKNDLWFEYLTNNVKALNLKNVIEIHGDGYEIIPNLTNVDAIYVDPPWGGKQYKEQKVLRLNYSDKSLEDTVLSFLDTTKSDIKLVALKLPKNYDIKYLYDTVKKNNNVRIIMYNLEKMTIIIIENNKKSLD